MAKFRPIKKTRTVLERWKDEKLEKPAKNGMTNPTEDKKEEKDQFQNEEKRKKLERGRSFVNALLSFPFLHILTSPHL